MVGGARAATFEGVHVSAHGHGKEIFMARWVSVLIVVAIAGAGCQTNPFQQRSGPPADLDNSYDPPPQGLAMSPEQRFSDIPLPVGLREDYDRSFVYEEAGLAVGRMVYKTNRASMGELAQFFIEECPAADWRLEKLIESARGKELLFQKPNKRLVIEISNLGLVQGREVTITLTPDGSQ